jgi:hypothetical protein
MDRELLVQAVPSNDELLAAPLYRQKEAAERLIESILDALDADGRQPDRWEAEHLAAALGFILSTMYFASIAKSIIGLTSSEKRAAPETWGRTSDTATTHAFRSGLGYVQGTPAPNL